MQNCRFQADLFTSALAYGSGSLYAGVSRFAVVWIRKGIVKMAEKKNILTYAGLKQYEDELHNLKVFKRQEVAQKIKVVREQGDFSVNA